MIDATSIEKAAQAILAVAPLGSKVILFGSQARGEASEASDVDFLVVEPELHGRREEWLRLRQTLRPLRLPVDILVVSEHVFDQWKDTPNTVISEAAKEGRIYVRAA
jgi:uncharacterized protein